MAGWRKAAGCGRSTASGVTLALLAAFGTGAARGEAVVPPAVTAIAPEVLFVRTVGHWRAGPDTGIKRLLILRAPGTEDAVRLFVQWVKPPGARGAGEVVETVEIEEVFRERLRIVDYRVETAENDTVVFLDTVAPGTGTDETWELIVNEPGRFRVGRVSN